MAKFKKRKRSKSKPRTTFSSQPTANFDDPIMRHQAYRIKHEGINSYLVALAAWQRGLKVTFHYEVTTKSERFANTAVRNFHGELFSVSDGLKTHFFRRSQGDLTSRGSSAIAEDKQATKTKLKKSGIDVAEGIVVTKNDTVKEFLGAHQGKRFLIKPLSGSLGKGVIRNISADQVLQHIHSSQGEKLLLEEFIKGDEYRINVVDSRIINALIRLPANVVGDGRSTVENLIKLKNMWRQQHPRYYKDSIKVNAKAEQMLMEQGMAITSIPPKDFQVWLNDVPSTTYGGDLIDCSATVPYSAQRTAIATQQALELPTIGVDLIVCDNERVVVLEANQCPYTSAGVLPLKPDVPSPGNLFAEAIIDYYFPDSIDKTRHVKASFDFLLVCRTLQSGMVAEVTLPVIGPDWVHRRMRIPAANVDDKTEKTVKKHVFTMGIHAQLFKNNEGEIFIDLIAAKKRSDAIVKNLCTPHQAVPGR